MTCDARKRICLSTEDATIRAQSWVRLVMEDATTRLRPAWMNEYVAFAANSYQDTADVLHRSDEDVILGVVLIDWRWIQLCHAVDAGEHVPPSVTSSMACDSVSLWERQSRRTSVEHLAGVTCQRMSPSEVALRRKERDAAEAVVVLCLIISLWSRVLVDRS